MFVFLRLLGHGTEVTDAAPSQQKIVLVQATGGIIAGATASCITTPLDTIKTRLQVDNFDIDMIECTSCSNSSCVCVCVCVVIVLIYTHP